MGIDKNIENNNKLMQSWNFEKNKKHPSQYKTYEDKVWWKCTDCGEEFFKKINQMLRQSSGNGCGFCYGRTPGKFNNLLVLHPDIAKEWHPTLNALTPEQVVPGSNKKFWWKCSVCTEEYMSIVGNRTNKNAPTACPYCAGKKIGKFNNFEYLHKNDLLKDWNYSLNTDKPSEITCGTNKKYWWNCSHEHPPYQTQIKERKRGSSCPRCYRSKSKKEIDWLNLLNINIDFSVKTLKIINFNYKLSIDAYCPDTNTVYEFHGDFWHGHPKYFDQNKIHPFKKGGKLLTFGEKYKNTIFKDNSIILSGFNLIKIWEHEYDELKEKYPNINDFKYHINSHALQQIYLEIGSFI